MHLFARNIRKVTLVTMVAVVFGWQKEPKPGNKPKNQKSVCTEENGCVQAVLCICFHGRLAWDSQDESLRKCQKFRKVVFDYIPLTNEPLDSMV